MPEQRGLVHLNSASKLRIMMQFLQAGGNALALRTMHDGRSRCLVEAAADNAIFSLDSGLAIAASNQRPASVRSFKTCGGS